jgi:transposase
MRFYTQQHQCYCGIDLHARTMDVCILHHDGEIVGHRNMPTRPEALLKTMAPSRETRVIAVECLFTGDWLADLCAREQLPFVLGHALSMKALHGGKAKHDRIEAQKSAVLRRGGMLPQAYGSPAEMRATRDLLRRRRPRRRQRAALLTPVQHTHGQDNWPESGPQSASQTQRAGVAERWADPAVHKSSAVDRALIADDDPLRRAVALAIVTTAQPQDANPLSWLQTVPGLGQLLSRVLWDERPAIARCPRVHDCGSACRLVQCAKAAAGKRDGTSGTKIGQASRTWACSEAAGLGLRNQPAGQTSLAR